jgi:Uma2 family endonuclease
MRPPRLKGWLADDLDHLPEAPPHTELFDDMLILRLAPRPSWHGLLINAFVSALSEQTPTGVRIEPQMTIRLDKHNRCEPGLLATTAAYDAARTFCTPDQALLVVEVVSPESAHHDRTVKPRKYAEAGVAHYWRVEEQEEDSAPVLYAYETGPLRLRARRSHPGVCADRHPSRRVADRQAVRDDDRPGRAASHYTLKRNSTTSPSCMT